jgi:Tfp pilus assembly protein PilF
MSEHDKDARLERLLEFRERDPGNEQLTLECAEAALAADRPGLALELLTELSAGSEPDGQAANLAGIAAMRSGDQQAAQASFRRLLESHPDDPSLRFNLAWSMALDDDKQGALAMLDEQVVEALPQAAMLDLQLRHEDGQWEEAAERIHRHLDRFPDYAPLQAAASVLAMDLDDAELARSCALKAGDHPDAMVTLGILELGENRTADASARFTKSLEARTRNPRARIGLGLARLAEGRATDAAEQLDAGAREFEDHLGSWIAAGWAHALAGDLSAARQRFETATVADDSFAEAHGSLAALDAIEGQTQSARRRLEIALRLDRQCFSAALAGVLLASAEGNADRARKIFETALKQPIMPDGKTLGSALAGIAL